MINDEQEEQLNNEEMVHNAPLTAAIETKYQDKNDFGDEELEDQFEYEYDDRLVDESEDEDQEIDDFINGPEEQISNQGNSESSFHFVKNSMLSSNSMIRKLNSLEVDKDEVSNSGSSKRQMMDYTNNIASSGAKPGKKAKK